MNRVVVPPGGFAGYAQMTPASRASWSGSASRGGARKRKRKSSKPRSTRRAKRASSKSGRKMKFGSPAWQKKYKVGKFRKK